MTTEFVSVPMAMTVEEALVSVRTVARNGRREAMYSVYATDADGRVQGVLSLRELLAAPEGSRISDIAWSEVVSVKPTADREEVARKTTNYDLVAVPVVNDNGQIIGVVTVDDVIDAIQEEQTEDVQKFGGMEALDVPYMQIGLLGMIRKRAGWLCVLLLGEFLTAAAMGHYEADISHAVVLALFVPLIISSGGNSGSQATSLIIRAMALQEIHLKDWWRVALREIPSALVLGVILGVIGFGRVMVWHELGLYDYGAHAIRIALTVGLALVGVVTFGSLTGSMLPFLLRRIGFDPASSSAPFVATLVDVTGLIIYFNVAFLLLRGRLL
jgi:magnesium transporter